MNLNHFKIVAKKNKPQLKKFLQKLDTVVPENFQEIIKEEDDKMWARTDCTTCANCCKTMTPTYTKTDIKRIATHLKISEKEMYDNWLTKDDDNGDIINKSTPCQFLVDNKCSIYEVRPKDCAEFPHHHKRPFDQYNDTFIQNLDKCPATYRLVAVLKKRVEKEYEW